MCPGVVLEGTVTSAFPLLLQALLELEMNSDLKAQLRELNITAAKVRWLTGVQDSFFF